MHQSTRADTVNQGKYCIMMPAAQGLITDLAACGHPVVVGPSRKSFIGRLTGAPVNDRLGGTLAALIPSIGLDRVAVRVHNPGPAVQFLELAGLISESAA